MKPPIKPYKAKAYRVPTPPVKMRRKTVSEEIADIEAGLPPPWVEPEPPQSWWARLKAAWFANLRN